MSYDLQVWSVRALQPDAFRQPELWERGASSWTHARKNWQIVISASDRVEPEDIPEEVSKLLPGIEWLTNLNLEGKRTAEALRLSQSTAIDIARSSHGAVLDPQGDSVRLPSGVKRLMLPRSKDTFEVVSMSWWFLDSPLLSREGRESFVKLLERTLPEALPKRYGLYEPPQHVYAKTGKAHLLDFIDANLHDMMVFYPQRPVTSLYVGFPNPLGAYKIGFRSNRLEIEVEKEALSQPGWANSLKLFWQQASIRIRPFYGDVRVLGGYRWMGATVSPGHQHPHPVTSWWWAGIPNVLGAAVVLGDTYQKLWPSFVSAATVIDGLAFVSIDDWSKNGDLVEKVGPPPGEQVQTSTNFEVGKQKYPSGWPFGEPFAS
jgi:hypothetical protein